MPKIEQNSLNVDSLPLPPLKAKCERKYVEVPRIIEKMHEDVLVTYAMD